MNKSDLAQTLSEEEMRSMLAYTRLVAEKAVEEIREGYIAPSPTDQACEHCDARAICHYAGVFPRETKGSFDVALLERLMQEEGEC